MNNSFLQEGLNRTVKELFIFLKSRVKNKEFQCYISLIDLTNNVEYYIEKYISKKIETDLSELFKNKEYINELKLNIEQRNISVFKENISIFKDLKIDEWYKELDAENQTILWKYFKNLFKIATMLSKTKNNTFFSPPIPKH